MPLRKKIDKNRIILLKNIYKIKNPNQFFIFLQKVYHTEKFLTIFALPCRPCPSIAGRYVRPSASAPFHNKGLPKNWSAPCCRTPPAVLQSFVRNRRKYQLPRISAKPCAPPFYSFTNRSILHTWVFVSSS